MTKINNLQKQTVAQTRDRILANVRKAPSTKIYEELSTKMNKDNVDTLLSLVERSINFMYLFDMKVPKIASTQFVSLVRPLLQDLKAVDVKGKGLAIIKAIAIFDYMQPFPSSVDEFNKDLKLHRKRLLISTNMVGHLLSKMCKK